MSTMDTPPEPREPTVYNGHSMALVYRWTPLLRSQSLSAPLALAAIIHGAVTPEQLIILLLVCGMTRRRRPTERAAAA